MQVQIGELSRRTGVSPRALRHYEQQALLRPDRGLNGYRTFTVEDVATVARIRIMLNAGLSTTTIQRYLDCIREGTDGRDIQLCPALRHELDHVQRRLDLETQRIEETRAALCALSGRHSSQIIVEATGVGERCSQSRVSSGSATGTKP